MVLPRLGILTPASLEPKVGILARVRSNFGESLGFHVVKFLLIHEVPNHSHYFNGEKASFNHEDKVGSIYFNLKVVGYKLLLN